jgi:phosphatidylserine synthase
MGGIPAFLLACWYVKINAPELAILAISIAFLFDTIDGKVARKQEPTQFGRELDSFFDLLYYIVFPSLFILAFLNPWTPLTIIALSTITIAGALRLVRFNRQGFTATDDGSAYPGLATVYFLLVPPVMYLTTNVIWSQAVWATPAITVVFAVLMVLPYPIQKPKTGVWYVVAIIINILMLLVWMHII